MTTKYLLKCKCYEKDALKTETEKDDQEPQQ